MQKQLYSIVCGIAMLASSTIVRADFIVQVDVDPGTSGIQVSRTVNVGDTVTANIFLNLTSVADSLIAYNFNLQYNPAVLTFQEPRLETPQNLGGGFANGVLSTNKLTSGGFIRQFDGIASGAGASGPFAAPIQIASLTFLATSAGSSAILPGAFDQTFNQWFNADLNDVTTQVQFRGATITAVPEPGSLALLAVVGSVLGYGVRRKYKLQTVKALAVGK